MSAAQHFELHYYLAVLRVLDYAADAMGSLDAVFRQYPFLAAYNDELARHGMHGRTLHDAALCWREKIDACERESPSHLPIRALALAAGLDAEAIALLMTAGLAEEDPRFADLLPGPLMVVGESRAAARRLLELGLWTPARQVPAAVWDALRGDAPEWPLPWLRYRPPESLLPIEDLLVPDDFRDRLRAAAALLGEGRISAIVLRGPRHNGRRTALGAVARALGRGVLEFAAPAKSEEDRWTAVALQCAIRGAMACLVVDAAPGESVEVPQVPMDPPPLTIALGRYGGLKGPAVERAVALSLPMPGPDLRRRAWQAFAPSANGCAGSAAAFRLPTGQIHRAAAMAASAAALAGRAHFDPSDIRAACQALHRHSFESLAQAIDTSGGWAQLAVSPDTAEELRSLELRCRYRERIPGGPGVRALLKGPSGTGKTLAAKALASALEMDLYRVDLSTVVNKYIGETEKNLNQIFSLAEELDVILFLDEGDALLAPRTGVQNSNDRYANLETNYLLQRVESFEGILVVATNAGDRIDGAFQRRMDVAIAFRPPETAERWIIWQLHLPEDHAVDASVLSEVARRCVLTGGQIRNASLHAALLAMDCGSAVTPAILRSAVEREYRKAGGVCPLRPAD